jgi:hypothetical protein
MIEFSFVDSYLFWDISYLVLLDVDSAFSCCRPDFDTRREVGIFHKLDQHGEDGCWWRNEIGHLGLLCTISRIYDKV